MLGVIVVGVIVYEASKLIGNKLIALGARLWEVTDEREIRSI